MRPLTPRQEEVVDLVARGLSNAEAAAVLGLSPHTVKGHLAAASERLGAKGRGELAHAFLTRLRGCPSCGATFT